MNPNLDKLLDRLGEAAQHLVAARAEQLFEEAYEEAVAEGKDLVKERLLQAMVEQSTVWLAQKAAEDPVPLVPEALASTTPADLPHGSVREANTGEVRAPHDTDSDMLDGTLEWAGEEPMRWSEDDTGAPITFTFDEPGPMSTRESKLASFEDVMSQALTGHAEKETAAPEDEASENGASKNGASENGASENGASEEAELLHELALIRKQIDRNEHLLGQLQPFLRQLQ